MANTVDCIFDGLLTVGADTAATLVLVPSIGWVHHNDVGWHTTRGSWLTGSPEAGFYTSHDEVDIADAVGDDPAADPEDTP